jgi:ankyrin repeat protein
VNCTTPIKCCIAAQQGHGAVVSQLLKAKAIAVNQANTDGATPLYIAAQEGCGAVAVLLLKAKNIAVNQTNADGVTPLYLAAENGHGGEEARRGAGVAAGAEER